MRLVALTLACFIVSFCCGQGTVDDSAWELVTIKSSDTYGRANKVFPFDENFKIEFSIKGKYEKGDINVRMMGRSQYRRPDFPIASIEREHLICDAMDEELSAYQQRLFSFCIGRHVGVGLDLTVFKFPRPCQLAGTPYSDPTRKRRFDLQGKDYFKYAFWEVRAPRMLSVDSLTYMKGRGNMLYNWTSEYYVTLPPEAVAFSYDSNAKTTTIHIAVGEYGVNANGETIRDSLGAFHNYMKPKWNYYFYLEPKKASQKAHDVIAKLAWKPIQLIDPRLSSQLPILERTTEQMQGVLLRGENPWRIKHGASVSELLTELNVLKLAYRQAYTATAANRDVISAQCTTHIAPCAEIALTNPPYNIGTGGLDSIQRMQLVNLQFALDPCPIHPSISWGDLWFSGLVPAGITELPESFDVKKQNANLKAFKAMLSSFVNWVQLTPFNDISMCPNLRSEILTAVLEVEKIQHEFQTRISANQASAASWIDKNLYSSKKTVLPGNKTIQGTTHNTVKTQQERQISLETGLGITWPNSSSGNLFNIEGFSYLGAQINFRPINTATPFRRHHYPGLGFATRHRFSWMVGLTLNTLPEKAGRSGFVGNRGAVVGMGYRFNHYLRLTAGSMLVKKDISASEFLQGTQMAAQPFVSLSFDLRLDGLKKLASGNPSL